MALNEQYTIEVAEAVAPHRVYWMEECLPPHDFEGFGRLRAAIKSTRIVTAVVVEVAIQFLAHRHTAPMEPRLDHILSQIQNLRGLFGRELLDVAQQDYRAERRRKF